jgi:MFS transporter, DHA1 family, inner membrane transport protein
MLEASPAASMASRRAVPAFVIGDFAIGLGIWLPAATMNSLVLEFQEQPETLGLLVSLAAIVVCIGAPIYAALTNRWDRRNLLAGSLALYAIGHGAFAFADSFNAALSVRLLMISSAAIFTPQAAGSPCAGRPASLFGGGGA